MKKKEKGERNGDPLGCYSHRCRDRRSFVSEVGTTVKNLDFFCYRRRWSKMEFFRERFVNGMRMSSITLYQTYYTREVNNGMGNEKSFGTVN